MLRDINKGENHVSHGNSVQMKRMCWRIIDESRLLDISKYLNEMGDKSHFRGNLSSKTH